jgi:hypothetical protein
MKKVLLFFCALGFFGIHAQNTPTEIQQKMLKLAKIAKPQNRQIDARGGEICTPDSTISFQNNSATDSSIIGKTLFEYNAANQVTHRKFYQIDDFSGVLLATTEDFYQYNPNGALVYNLAKFVNYVTNNLDTDRVNYYFPRGTSSTLLDSEVLWTVDFNTLLLIRTSKTSYFYDANDLPAQIIDYIYDNSAGWILNSKTEYNYNSKSQPILTVNSNWDDPNWVLNSKYEFSYDANDSLTLFLGTNLVDSMPTSQATYEYDLALHTTKFTLEFWDATAGDWQFFVYNISDYDNQNRLESQENFFDYPGFLTGGERHIFHYPSTSDCVSFTDDFVTSDGNNWVDFGNTYYYYNGSIISTNSLVINDLSVLISPNPFVEKFNIDAPNGSQIEVFSAAGKRMLELRASDHLTEIDGTNLPNGAYFISIKNAGRVVTKLVTKMD